MIKKIKLKFGSSQTKPQLDTELTPITVFVGPNNSGKSKVLIEIEKFCKEGLLNTTNVILTDLEFNNLPDPESEINNHTLSPRFNESLQPNHIFFGKENTRHQLQKPELIRILNDANANKNAYAVYYVSFNTIRIDGGSRINLINEQSAGDLQSHPVNSLQVLFKDNNKRKELRRIIFDAFKKYFVIDPTHLGNLRIRLSDIAPVNDIQERGIHEDAVKFHNNALNITQASDGVKAFTGIMTTIIAGDPKVILIDEPEAFLHPSLASNLGKEVSNSVNGSFKNLFVSTHSANFLMGCIHSGTPLNIIRLTYSNNVPTARILPSEKVLKLMRHPLLRSTGVLNGLFYEYVIVTEADSDRAFYQEINERLLAYEPSKGIPNCLFLNAQNKQTIHEILRPLREMGIPCAAIVDVDVVKEGGTVWTNLLNSANVPNVTIQSTGISRGYIKSAFDAKGINFKTNGGVEVLDNPEKEACNNLFDQLDEYGIFAVRKGELESWLKPLGTTASHSPEWLIEIFEKLGEDPSSATYVKPSVGDIWDFIFKIKTWFSNPTRKGTPE
ncbi:ATP-dependent nuclease [Flavobacterium yafengii]|uniref:ATP-dependent nuclease n=1 Tax=Flavobacterium yafengii TaxID=3041253 RepID=UPI0024A948E9|nr:AAA family ATPase [Flavobacterium yafengii]MDI5888938.1 AAA family ATPase [Flavobacterium yafengii]